MSAPTSIPALTLRDVRIDRAGEVMLEASSFTCDTSKTVVACASPLLFEVVSGMREAVSGSLTYGSRELREAITLGLVVSAPRDPNLPPNWTVREYVEAGASLAGVPRSRVRDAALGAMKALGIDGASSLKLGKATRGLRRGAVLAGALASDAELVVLEDPTADLADDERTIMASILLEAMGDRRWIVFTPRVVASVPFCTAADTILVVSGGTTAAQGSGNDLARRFGAYLVRFDGPRDAFENELREGHVDVAPGERPDTVHVTLATDAGTLALFESAKRANVRILELASAHPAFA